MWKFNQKVSRKNPAAGLNRKEVLHYLGVILLKIQIQQGAIWY